MQCRFSKTQRVGSPGREAQASHPPPPRADPPYFSHFLEDARCKLHLSAFFSFWDSSVHWCQRKWKSRREGKQAKPHGECPEYLASLYKCCWWFVDSSAHNTSYIGASTRPAVWLQEACSECDIGLSFSLAARKLRALCWYLVEKAIFIMGFWYTFHPITTTYQMKFDY